MIRLRPYRFLLAVFGSIFVHIAAAVAMLIAVPAIAPTELFRPISVSLVPESSIPGTGLQLQEQTEEMGTEFPSDIATSSTPVEQIPEVEEVQDQNDDVGETLQAETTSELDTIQHEITDVEPTEVARLDPDLISEPAQFQPDDVSTDQPSPKIETIQVIEQPSVQEARDTEEIQIQTTAEEQIVLTPDLPQSSAPRLPEEINSESVDPIDRPTDQADRPEVQTDLAYTEDAVEDETVMMPVETNLSNINATLMIQPTETKPVRDGTDAESELTARVFPDSIQDIIEDYSFTATPNKPASIPVTPQVDAQPAETEIAEIVHADNEIEIDLADEFEIRLAYSDSDGSEFITEISKQLEPPELQESKVASIAKVDFAPLTDATDAESEFALRIFPDSILDVPEFKPISTDILKSVDAQSLPEDLADTRPIRSETEDFLIDEIKVRITYSEFDDPDAGITEKVELSIQPVTKVASISNTESIPIPTDAESELIAHVFPDSILDRAEIQSSTSTFDKTVDVLNTEIAGTQQQETVVTQIEPTREEKPVELTDEFEVRIAYMELDESELVSEVPQQLEQPKQDDLNTTSNAKVTESIPTRITIDVESELSARVFAHAIQDVLEIQPVSTPVRETVDSPKPQPIDTPVEEAELPKVEPTSQKSVIDLADKFETRLAYSDQLDSDLVTDPIERINPSEPDELKLASIATTQPTQIATEFKEVTTQQQDISREEIPENSDSENPQPKLAKIDQNVPEPVETERPEQPIDNNAKVTEEPSSVDETSAANNPTQLAAVQSLSDSVGSIQELNVAPQFGVSGVSNPAPRYPYKSRANNEEGQVILRVYVDSKGNARKVETHTSSGYRRLDKAAKKAVRKWKFQPARVAGVISEGVALVPVTFVLK